MYIIRHSVFVVVVVVVFNSVHSKNFHYPTRGGFVVVVVVFNSVQLNKTFNYSTRGNFVVVAAVVVSPFSFCLFLFILPVTCLFIFSGRAIGARLIQAKRTCCTEVYF